MKPLLATLRNKKRYIAFEVITENDATEKEVWNAISREVLEMAGTKNYGKTELSMPKYDTTTKKGILKTSHKHAKDIIASTAFITKISDNPAIVRTLKTSGMINKIIIPATTNGEV